MKRLFNGTERWFAWYPVQCGALGGDGWAWLTHVTRVPGRVTIYQKIK